NCCPVSRIARPTSPSRTANRCASSRKRNGRPKTRNSGTKLSSALEDTFVRPRLPICSSSSVSRSEPSWPLESTSMRIVESDFSISSSFIRTIALWTGCETSRPCPSLMATTSLWRVQPVANRARTRIRNVVEVRISECHSFFPDGDLAVVVDFVLRELLPGSDAKYEIEKVVFEGGQVRRTVE